MDVIGHPANGLGDTVHLTNHTAQICMKAIAPRLSDPRFAPFCTENHMVMQTQMRGCHTMRMLPAPLLGRTPFLLCVTGGVTAG